MSRLARLIALLILPLALGAAACGANSEPDVGGAAPTGSAGDDREADEEPGADEAGDDAAAGEGLTVVASVYPLAWVAEQVAPGAEVILLADAGDEPHDIDLTPRARQALETADVVLHMGDIGYQPQVESAVADRGGAVVSVADVVGSDALLERDEGHHHDHVEGEIDPHAWFHAGLMAEVAEATGAALASADPAGGDAYQSGADALASDLRDLHAEIGSLLGGDCAHDLVIVSHEAYAYLLEPHGLRQEGISSSAGHGPASPQRIAELVRLARSEGIEHVLAEPVEGREDAHAVASEAGLEVLDIHSLEVRGDELDGRGFDELLREQARTAARAMGCE